MTVYFGEYIIWGFHKVGAVTDRFELTWVADE